MAKLEPSRAWKGSKESVVSSVSVVVVQSQQLPWKSQEQPKQGQSRADISITLSNCPRNAQTGQSGAKGNKEFYVVVVHSQHLPWSGKVL